MYHYTQHSFFFLNNNFTWESWWSLLLFIFTWNDLSCTFRAEVDQHSYLFDAIINKRISLNFLDPPPLLLFSILFGPCFFFALLVPVLLFVVYNPSSFSLMLSFVI
jgi:hypothetical protein